MARAEPLAWGHRAGCDFVRASCAAWPAGVRCERREQEACSHDHLAKAYCDLQEYGGALPPGARYFDAPPAGGADASLGGYSALLDYCPVYRPAPTATAQEEPRVGGTPGEGFARRAAAWWRSPPAAAAAAAAARPSATRRAASAARPSDPPRGPLAGAARGGPSRRATSLRGRRASGCPPARLCGLAAGYWPRPASLEPTEGSVARASPSRSAAPRRAAPPAPSLSSPNPATFPTPPAAAAASAV